MTIHQDIGQTLYLSLLRYALDSSDVFLLACAVQPPPYMDGNLRASAMRGLGLRPDARTMQRLQEEKERYEQDAAQFASHCLPFLQKLAPLLLRERSNPEWPSTKILSSPIAYTVRLYRACPDAFPLLRQPGSYFAWRYPLYPEDLSFFRRGRCWLYASSHEQYVEVFPRDIHEYRFLVEMGVPLGEPYAWVPESELFWEDYTLP